MLFVLAVLAASCLAGEIEHKLLLAKDLPQILLSPVGRGYTNEPLADVVQDLLGPSIDVICKTDISDLRVSYNPRGQSTAEVLIDVCLPRLLAWSPMNTIVLLASTNEVEHAVEMSQLLRQIRARPGEDDAFGLLCFHGMHIEDTVSLLRNMCGVSISNLVTNSSESGFLADATLRGKRWRDWFWASVVLSSTTLRVNGQTITVDERSRKTGELGSEYQEKVNGKN